MALQRYGKIRWFTAREYVDKETGEMLSKSRVERERWIKDGSTYRIEYKKEYNKKQ